MERVKVEENVDAFGICNEDDLRRVRFQERVRLILSDHRRPPVARKILDGLLADLNSKLRTVKKIMELEGEDLEYQELLGVALEDVVVPEEFSIEPASLVSDLELNAGLKGSEIRLKISLPSSLFLEKDYLQNLYFWKKYCFLKTVGNALESTNSIQEVKIVYLRDDPRSPVLSFNYKTKTSTQQKVLLIPYLKEDVFPPRRFLMEQNNLRNLRDKNNQLKPSIEYNLSILKDMTLFTNTAHLDAAFDRLNSKTSIHDALILIKVWCRGHWLETVDGFDDFSWTLVTLRCIKAGLITPTASSLDIFHGILFLLTSPKHFKDISKDSENLWINSNHSNLKLVSSDRVPSYENFKLCNLECIVDVTGYYNCIWDVSSSWMDRLRAVAKRTLTFLQMDQFQITHDEVFLNPLPLKAEFDVVMEVELDLGDSKGILLNKDKSELRSLIEKLEEVLKQGLTDRWSIFRVLRKTPGDWSPVKEVLSRSKTLWICLGLSKETSDRLVDHGPSPEDQQGARKFRKFWGKKSELKKFSDGKICEAVTWNPYQITEQIIKHLLSLHFNFNAKSCSVNDAQLGDFSNQETNFKNLQNSAQQLIALLKNLKDLALRVVNVQELDPVFRKTKCFGADYHPLVDEVESIEIAVSRCVDPVVLLVHLEGSGSWPIHEEAYKKTKIAIQVQLSKELNKQGVFCKANEEFVDLFFKGFVFRMYLTTERDANSGDEEGVKRRILERKYHGLISQLVSQHGSFSLSVQLLKRWFSANLFDFHFDELILELIMVYVYTHRSPRPVPRTALTGFFRALTLIGTFPWTTTPLIIDIDSEMKEDKIRSIEDWYTQDGGLCLLAICTPFDEISTLTRNKPSEKSILTRLIHLVNRTLGEEGEDLKTVFGPNLSGFDVVIEIKRTSIPHPEQQFSVHGSNSQSKEPVKTQNEVVLSHIPPELMERFSKKQIRTQLLIGFDPVLRFLELLNQHFGFVGIFCYDRFGGDKIIVRWKPEKLIPTAEPDFSELAYWCPTEVGFMPDIPSILQDIQNLGSGLVKSVGIL